MTTALVYNVEPKKRLVLNKILQFDPTRTLSLRKRFIADLNKRFRVLKGDILKTIDENDAFGLKNPRLRLFAAAPVRAFQFATDARKVEGFLDWLDEQVDEGILEVQVREGRKIVAHSGWEKIHIESAYKRGMERGNAELGKAGFDPVFEARFIDAAFNRPIHADRVGLIFTRTFNELKGITDAMGQQIGRILAQGLADGLGPRQLAREINRNVDISLKRARTLARTEVIRAHHVATINIYREAQIEGILIQAEFSTAKDDRVCVRCAALEGNVFPLDIIEGLIPVHPNCRCIALPADVGEEVKKGRKRIKSKKQVEGIMDRAVAREKAQRRRQRRRQP